MTSQRWIILGVIVVVVLLGILLYTNKKTPAQSPLDIVAGPPQSSEAGLGGAPSPLAQGKQTYTILTEKPSDYQIIQVDVDPLDVKKGETQTVTVTVKDANNSPITKENIVQGTVFTDLKTSNFTASLVQADGPDLTIIWKGSWALQDTTDKNYMITINAENGKSNSKVDLSFR